MKINIAIFLILISGSIAFAETTAFDSMDKAIEVKLAPAIKTQSTASGANKTTTAATQSSTTIQVQKFNNALTNLDDAQVELRQELATATSKYNSALIEKEKAIQNCKNLKNEIKTISKKMKNNDKAKKMINANLETKS